MDRESFNADRKFGMLIDGEWQAAASSQVFSCVDPYTEKSWGSVPAADAADGGGVPRRRRRDLRAPPPQWIRRGVPAAPGRDPWPGFHLPQAVWPPLKPGDGRIA